MNIFSLEKLREDATAWINFPGRSRFQLAKKSGIEWKSLERFLSDDDAGLSGKSIEKLWPILYPSPPTPEECHNQPAE